MTTSTTPTPNATTDDVFEQNDNNVIAFPLVAILPFTLRGKEIYRPNPNTTAPMAFTHLASAVLAMRDFNQRQSNVVPELAQALYQDCPVQIPVANISIADSKSSVVATSAFLLDQVQQGRPFQAILGPYYNEPAYEASTIAKGLKIPMISHGATDNDFIRGGHPTAFKSINHLHPMGEALINWLLSKGRNDFLAVIHVSHNFGAQYAQGIQGAAGRLGFTTLDYHVISPPFTGFSPNRSVRYAAYQVKLSTKRTIVAITMNVDELKLLASAAQEFGILGPDYVWVIGFNLDKDLLLYEATKDANLTKMVDGAAMIHHIDGFEYNSALQESDPFLEQWQGTQGSEAEDLLKTINQLNPIQNQEKAGYYLPEADFFQTQMPQMGSGYLYDAVMVAGMGNAMNGMH